MESSPPLRPIRPPHFSKIFIPIVIVALSHIPACAQTSQPVLTRLAEAQLDSLASRITEKIKKTNLDEARAKILVFDFTWETPERSSRYGTLLADRFSAMLKSNSGVDIVDRQLVKDYLTENYTNIEDLNSNVLCLELAKDFGATTIIRAQLVEKPDQQLKVTLEAVGYAHSLYDTAEFEITDSAEDLLSQPVPPYAKEPDNIPAEPGVLVVGSTGVDGVILPSCISCPDAPYSRMASVEKLQGTVVLSALVSTTGEVSSIYIVKPLPGGLTQQAVKAVQNWKLKPAMKDGQPISVRLHIEMTFRLI